MQTKQNWLKNLLSIMKENRLTSMSFTKIFNRFQLKIVEIIDEILGFWILLDCNRILIN
jgi:hypothetical protein